ncbi:hypothetical protein SteCoe_36655 [Stentor coeruleus]|uniref:Uncharacterized protein n=1 Tax=Stentor coeruleus TaxID=5963 RepID=A0A1R2AQ07_9CILI|nr:hypothetical protein SteCoe_36655 [Stentor coeruleus]
MMYSKPFIDWRSTSLISSNDEYGLIAIGKNSELHLYKSSDIISSLESSTSFSKVLLPDPITHVSISPSCSQIAVLTVTTLFFLSTSRSIKGGKPISEFKLDSLGRALDWKGNRLGVLTQSGKLEIFINTQRANQRKEGVKSFCFIKGVDNFCVVAGNDGLCIIDMNTWNIIRQTAVEGQILCLKEFDGLIYAFALDEENKIMGVDKELDIIFSISDVSLASYLIRQNIPAEGFSGFMDFLNNKKTLLFSNTNHSYIDVLYFNDQFSLMNFEENEAGKLQMDFKKEQNQSFQQVVFGFALIKSIVSDEVEIFECRGDTYEIVPPPYVITLSSSGEISVYKFIDLRAEYINTVSCERPKKRIEDIIDDIENKEQSRYQDVSKNLFGKSEDIGFGMKKSQGVEESKSLKDDPNIGCSLVAGSQKMLGDNKSLKVFGESQSTTNNLFLKNTSNALASNNSNPFVLSAMNDSGGLSKETKPFAPIAGLNFPNSNALNTGTGFISQSPNPNIFGSNTNASSILKTTSQNPSTNLDPNTQPVSKTQLFGVSNNSPQNNSFFTSNPQNSFLTNTSNDPKNPTFPSNPQNSFFSNTSNDPKNPQNSFLTNTSNDSKNPTFLSNPQSIPNFNTFQTPNSFNNLNQPLNPPTQKPFGFFFNPTSTNDPNSLNKSQNPGVSNPFLKSPLNLNQSLGFMSSPIKETTNPNLELAKKPQSQPKPLFNKDFMHNTSEVENACKIIRNTTKYYEMISKTINSFNFLKSFPNKNKNIRLRLSTLEKNINSSSSRAMNELLNIDDLQQTFKNLKTEIDGLNNNSNFSTLLNNSYINSLKKCNDLESFTEYYKGQISFLKEIKEKSLKKEKNFTGRNSKEEAKKQSEKNIRERVDKIKNDIEKLKRKIVVVNGNAQNYSKNITDLWDVDMYTYIDPDEHKKLLKNIKKPADSYSNESNKERINKIVSGKLVKTDLKVSTDINILIGSLSTQPAASKPKNIFPSIEKIKVFFDEIDKKMNFSKKKTNNEEEKKMSPERHARTSAEVKIPDKNENGGSFGAPPTTAPNPFSNTNFKVDDNTGSFGQGKANEANKPSGNTFVKTNDQPNPFSAKGNTSSQSSNPFNSASNPTNAFGKSPDTNQGTEEVKKAPNPFVAQKSAEGFAAKPGENPKTTGNAFTSQGTTEKTTSFFNTGQGSGGNTVKTGDTSQGSSFFVKPNDSGGSTSGFLSNPSQGSSFFASKTNEPQKNTGFPTKPNDSNPGFSNFSANSNQPGKKNESFFAAPNEGQKPLENVLGNKGQTGNSVGEANKQQSFLSSNPQNNSFGNKPLIPNTGITASNTGTFFNKTQEPNSSTGGFSNTGNSSNPFNAGNSSNPFNAGNSSNSFNAGNSSNPFNAGNSGNPFNAGQPGNAPNPFPNTNFGKPTGFNSPSNLPIMTGIETKAFGGGQNTAFTGFGNVPNNNNVPPQNVSPQIPPQNTQSAFFMLRK